MWFYNHFCCRHSLLFCPEDMLLTCFEKKKTLKNLWWGGDKWIWWNFWMSLCARLSWLFATVFIIFQPFFFIVLFFGGRLFQYKETPLPPTEAAGTENTFVCSRPLLHKETGLEKWKHVPSRQLGHTSMGPQPSNWHPAWAEVIEHLLEY